MKLGYSTIFWREPDLERCLAEAGWDGRLPLDSLGPPARVRRVCADAGLPLAVFHREWRPRGPERPHRGQDDQNALNPHANGDCERAPLVCLVADMFVDGHRSYAAGCRFR